MAKEDWGTKRLCQSCATKFYDFGRAPIVCPKCATTFDPETLLKSRRSRPSASKAAKASKPAPAPKPVKNEDDDIDVEVEVENGEDVAALADNDDDDSVLQDASDLGGDDVKDVVGSSEKGASSDDR